MSVDEIPEHSIVSPFGTSTPRLRKETERFEKYREFIIPWFRDIYALNRHSSRPWVCKICGSRVSNSSQTTILQHLASKKHLRCAGFSECQDERYNGRVSSKHTINSAETIVSSEINDVTNRADDE